MGCPTLLARAVLDQSERRSHKSAERTTVDPTMLARWQFATTTVYHFLIVPISIGLTALVAVMQTLAYRKRGTPARQCGGRHARDRVQELCDRLCVDAGRPARRHDLSVGADRQL